MAEEHTSGVHFLNTAHYDTGDVHPLILSAVLKLGTK